MNFKKISVFFLVFMTLWLASCSKNTADINEIINKGYNHIITLDANGGKLGNYTTRSLYVKKNSLIAEPGTNGIPQAVMLNHVLEGWYEGEKTEDGIEYKEKWNFKESRATKSVTLYAKWRLEYRVTIVYGENNESSKVVQTLTDESELIKRPTSNPTLTGYTFLEYYRDEDLTEVFEFDRAYSFKDENNEEFFELIIYTKWLEGKWNVVRTAEDMVKFNAATNLYIMNDLDFEGLTIKWPDSYSGKIEGNNHCIKNINFTKQQSGGISQRNFGLIGQISDATINDLTFQNCKVEFAIAVGTPYVGFLAGRIDGTTKISNVTLENCVVNVVTDLQNVQTSIIYGMKTNAVVLENVTKDEKSIVTYNN